MVLFEPGDRVTIHLSDGQGIGNCEVLEYEQGLLKVRRTGAEVVYNLRSLALLSVSRQQ